MLSFFPSPYPNELLYSVLARYHVRSGNTSAKMTMTDLFGISSVKAVVDMPSCIDMLVSRLPKEKKIKVFDLIMNNTLFPYYTAFLPEHRKKAIIAAMKGNKGSSIHEMTGIMASSIKVSEYLRFCPDCAKEDKEKYGEYYWHRLHQMPGVILCPIHNITVLDSTVNIGACYRHEFIPADERTCIIKPIEVKYSDTDKEGISLTSIDVFWVIKNYNYVRKYLTSNKDLKGVYLSLLKEKGYATSTGRVYQEEFITDFIKFYGNQILKTFQSDVDYDKESNWLSNIVRKHRKSFHPLRHLLLMRFLCGSVEEFFYNPNIYLPFGKGPWPCLNPAAEHYKKLVIKKVKISHCSDTKLPVGTFQCSCGFVYSRRGPDTHYDDLFKIGRIKQFGPIWEEKLKTMVADNRLGLRQKARLLKVDPKTINVYSQKLNSFSKGNTLDKHGLIAEDEHSKLLDLHRSAWLNLIKENPGKSKTALRKLFETHYIWLYRHDKVWLDLNSPKSKNESTYNSRVNWIERDLNILAKVKNVVEGIFNSNGKPVRASLSRIGKMSGLLALLEKHLEKMPKTKVYIETILETDVDYRKRRIEWAIRELNDSGLDPKSWLVMRKAGIRSEYRKEVEAFIFSEHDVLLKIENC